MSPRSGQPLPAEIFRECRQYEYAQVDVFADEPLAGNCSRCLPTPAA